MKAVDINLAPGVVLENRYRLIELLGGGGMGQVWAAQHMTLGHEVAIKMLHGSVMNSPEPRARFEREARIMARLGEMSRHIARVTEHGVLVDGTPYLVMDLLRGEGLDAALKREKKLSLDLAATVVTQLCKALIVAHAEGVVHRDIKPANIFLCKDEENNLLVKLLDFGVAKARAEIGGEQTMAGKVIGTPNYMAPEQLTGDTPVDHRADLFAVGSIAYRCTTGKTPFGTATLSEMAMRIVTMAPRVPSSLNPDLPAAFDAFMAKALAKQPSLRYQTARELAEALQELVHGRFSHPPPFGLMSEPVGEFSQISQSTGRLVAITGASPLEAVTHHAVSAPSVPAGFSLTLRPRWPSLRWLLVWGLIAPVFLGGLWFWPVASRRVRAWSEHRSVASPGSTVAPAVGHPAMVEGAASSTGLLGISSAAVPSSSSNGPKGPGLPVLSASAAVRPESSNAPAVESSSPTVSHGSAGKGSGRRPPRGRDGDGDLSPDTWAKRNEM